MAEEPDNGTDGAKPPAPAPCDSAKDCADYRYDPQPYEQLALVLQRNGMENEAASILFQKYEHESRAILREGGFGAYSEYVWKTVINALIGYGVYPFRSLYWFFGLVIVGYLVAQWSRSVLLQNDWDRAWYSFHNALPIITLSERLSGADHKIGWVTQFFRIQKVLGFILATLLASALTGLTS